MAGPWRAPSEALPPTPYDCWRRQRLYLMQLVRQVPQNQWRICQGVTGTHQAGEKGEGLSIFNQSTSDQGRLVRTCNFDHGCSYPAWIGMWTQCLNASSEALYLKVLRSTAQEYLSRKEHKLHSIGQLYFTAAKLRH